MLSPTDLAKIRAQGTCLEGESVYYVKDSNPGHWRLTLRGIAFYREALRTFGLTRTVPLVVSNQELFSLNKELLRAKTLELGQEVTAALAAKEVPSQQRMLAKALLTGGLPEVLAAAEQHNVCAAQGPEVIPGPCPAA